MESTGNNILPSSSSGQSDLLHVLLVHQGGVVVSMFAKKLYICLHKVAMAPASNNMPDVVLSILREKVCLCKGIIICEEAAPADNVLFQTIVKLTSELNIHAKVVSQDSSVARIWSGTSDECVYTSKGGMLYEVRMKTRANQMVMMEHQRSSSSTTSVAAIGSSSQVARANNNNNNNEIIATASNEGDHDQQQQLAMGSGSSDPVKKPRCVWTPKLSRGFQEAFNELESSKKGAAVPKKILEMMKTRMKDLPDWISREHIGSHLQKYRKGIAKQPMMVQAGGLADNIPTSSRPISNPSVAPGMPSCRSDPAAMCNAADQLNTLRIGEGHNLINGSTNLGSMMMEYDTFEMNQAGNFGRDPSPSGLGELDWTSTYGSYESQLGFGQQCLIPAGSVPAIEYGSVNNQYGPLSFRTDDDPTVEYGLWVDDQYDVSSFIANDHQMYNPVGNNAAAFNFAQQPNYNYAVQSNFSVPRQQQRINQNYNARVQSNSVPLNNYVAQQQQGGGTTQNYNAGGRVQSNSIPPNVPQQ